MNELFFSIINMSISGGIVILAIMLARLALRKTPKKWSYLLWIAAAFRLICPVSIKSAVSLFSFVPQQTLNSDAAVSATGRMEYIHHLARATQLPVPAASSLPSLAPVSSVTPSAVLTSAMPAPPVTASLVTAPPVTASLVTAPPVTASSVTVPSVTAPSVTAPVQGVLTHAPTQSALSGVTENAGAAAGSVVNLAQVLMTAAVVLWLAGLVALIAYSLIGYIKTYRRLATAVRLEGNVYRSEHVRSPFILGLIRPKIYIPYGLDPDAQSYVLAHERYHLKRCDHIIKILSFLLLAVHWFNPLCWLAFFLMNRDMEMSCDEKVLGQKLDIRRQYSTTLLSFAVGRQFPTMSPLAFSESGVRSRIKNAMNYKKPKTFVTITAIVLCLAVLAACVVNPTDNKTTPNPQEVDASAAPATNAPLTGAPVTGAPNANPTSVPPDYVPSANITFVNKLGQNTPSITDLKVTDGVYGDPIASYYSLNSYEGQNTADFTLRHTEGVSISAIAGTYDSYYNWVTMKYVIADFDAADGDTVELSDEKAELIHADGSREELILFKYEYDESFVLGMNEDLLHPIVTKEYISVDDSRYGYDTIALNEKEAAKYPLLAEALNALNEAVAARIASEYAQLSSKVFEGGDWYYEGDNVLTISRADGAVFSFITYKRTTLRGSEYSSVNFDTVTGKALALGDVVNDTVLLAKLLNEALLEAGVTEFNFAGDVPLSNGDYAWSIDHEGMSFFFNKGAFGTSRDYFSVFIPFEKLGDNFKSEYLPVTEDYIEFFSPIAISFPDHKKTFTVNGKVETAEMYSKYLDIEHWEAFDMFIHANGRDYLIISGEGDGGDGYVSALLLLGDGKACELKGVMEDGTAEGIWAYSTDPGMLKVYTTVFPLGKIDGSIYLSFNCDGEAVRLSSEVSTSRELTMLKDYETNEIDMNGSVIGSFTLKAGQKIVVFRATNDYADARTDDGHIVRIQYEGDELFETFDGVLYPEG